MVNLDHLARLLGPQGLWEHARFREPRWEHGYCTDDNARALVVTASLQERTAVAIFERCLQFVARGHTVNGWHNRMSSDGSWQDVAGPEDSLGRVVWGLGEAARHDRLPDGLRGIFHRATRRPLHHPRSVAYALLGASAAVGSVVDESARQAVSSLVGSLPLTPSGRWRWPEPRLTYDNARIPQAALEAGAVIGDRALQERGLDLLDWLVEVETGERGFSFTPVGGRGPGQSGPAFDQQPIEAWAMADACASAARITGVDHWWERAERAADWFRGLNDVGVGLYDPDTGAGYDGLEADGVNENCGAESTLSALGAELVRLRVPPRKSAAS